jgi:Anti-sigma-K factor rskA
VSDQLEPELERVARLLAETGPLPDAPAALRERALAIPDGGPVTAADDAAAARRPRRRWRAAPLAGLAAVVAAIVIAPAIALTQERSVNRDIELDPGTFAPKSGGSAHVVAHGDGSASIKLRVWKMPAAGQGRVYEAWLGRKGDRQPLGVFEIDSRGRATMDYKVPPGGLAGYRWLWVTSEPANSGEEPSDDKTALWGPVT